MNTIYANDLNVSGTTSFASLTVSGNASVTGTLGVNSTTSLKATNITGTLNIINTTANNSDTIGLVVGGNNTGNRVRVMADGIQAINNTSTSPLYLNYWGGTVCLSNGNQITANNGTFTTPTLTATNGVISRLYVPGELRALQYNIQSINNLGGSFLIGPTINVPAGNNVSITAINTTTNVVTANISGSFSLTTFPTVIWAENSKIKISGSIGGIPIGTCDGKLRAPLTTSTIQVEFTYGGQGTKPLSVANNQASVDLAVMIYTVGATNPIGIYMTSWGDTSWTDTTAQNKSSISIYGGTTSSDVAPTVSTPVVRIGNLSGLPTVNGSNPVGWGIYAQHGYFSGTIVSTSGNIGGWVLGSSDIHSTGHNAWNTANAGLYLGTTKIAGGSGGTWYLNEDGTGKVGRWAFASNGDLTTTVSNNTAGMGNATYAFWAGAASGSAASAPFRVTYAGALTATSATITGAITATSGTIGASNATNKITIGTNATNASIYYGMSTLSDTTNNGFYIGTDGIALGKGVFKVTNAGVLTATSATITGAITATSGTIGASNATNKITIGTNTTNASIYYGMSTLANTSNNGFYIGTDGIALGKGVFKVTNEGALTATSATITGAITATSGTIGSNSTAANRWQIGDKAIYNTCNSMTSTGVGTYVGVDGIRNYKSATAYVNIKDGVVTALGATITGTIHATGGEFGSASGYHIKIGTNAIDFYKGVETTSSNKYGSVGTNVWFGKSITIGSLADNSLVVGDTLSVDNDACFVQGYNSSAEGYASMACGNNCHAYNSYSFARGEACYAYGAYSSADGCLCTTGDENSDVGQYSHAEGYSTTATGNASHSEGRSTTALGDYSHAEGYSTLAYGDYSFASGYYTCAYGDYSHAEGINSTTGKFENDVASGGEYAHAEGQNTIAFGMASHAEGYLTQATGNYSHAEGYEAVASGDYSHAEGGSGYIDGTFKGPTASGLYSHAEGMGSLASGAVSHAEGSGTTASQHSAHAEGISTTASGQHSHAEGGGSVASGWRSHAQNGFTIAASDNQTAIGRYNIQDSNNVYAFIIGNGDLDDNDNPVRSNAFTVDWSGNVVASGSVTATSFVGNASSATKATQDANGATITSTYAKLSGAAFTGDVSINGDNLKSVASSTITDIITVNSTNATITAANIVKYGRIVQFRISWKNKNAITVGAGGNIGNITIGTFKTGYIPKIYTHAWSNGDDDGGAAWYSINTNGVLQLGALDARNASYTIAAGKLFNVGGFFIV